MLICLFFVRCMVKVTGDITVSFPASVLPLIYDVENAPMLSFLVRGTSCLEQILPNKALINRCAICQLSIEEWSSETICVGHYYCGCVVSSWLVHSTLDQAVLVRALAGDIMLCSWERHLTLTVPLSTQVYKWVPAKCWGVTLWWTGIPSSGK